MFEIDADNALQYLHETQRLPADVTARVETLAWGVSNAVMRVTPATGAPFVLKQSRAQLRTRDPWFSRLDRIWREVGMMRLLAPRLPPHVVPAILFEDRANYLFAMEAAPADHLVWKQLLLNGDADAAIAAQLGMYLGTIHRTTARDDALRAAWGDTEVFVQLRVDPFYRCLAERCPEARPGLERLIEQMSASPLSIVHADFSPKNVLVHDQGLTLVDFETGHYGDPAFDLGFFLSHLLLKTVLHHARFDEFAGLTTQFWKQYLNALHDSKPHTQQAHAAVTEFPGDPSYFSRTTQHLAACMWARIDGVSTIDYLPDPVCRECVRAFCRQLLTKAPTKWNCVLNLLRAICRRAGLDVPQAKVPPTDDPDRGNSTTVE